METSILEGMLKAEGINTNAKGSLSKEDFLRRLEIANQSGVNHYGELNFNIVRERFGTAATGEQKEEILKSWDNGYNYQKLN